MTDYDKLKKCFDEIGIEYEKDDEARQIIIRSKKSLEEICILFDKKFNFENIE